MLLHTWTQLKYAVRKTQPFNFDGEDPQEESEACVLYNLSKGQTMHLNEWRATTVQAWLRQ